MKGKIRVLLLSIALLFSTSSLLAQEMTEATHSKLGAFLTEYANKEVRVGNVKIDSVKVINKKLQIFAGVNLSYIPFNEDDVHDIYQQLGKIIPSKFTKYKLELFTDTKKIEELIVFKSEKKDLFKNKLSKPLVSNQSKPYQPTKGLLNHHLALWQSHGWYYEQKLARWEWQRARIFQTVEDLYTQSYVLPYLVPMLESAGANVLLPRERDTQSHEIIVDNDKFSANSSCLQTNGKEQWVQNTALSGFKHAKDSYLDGENPFKMGTFLQTRTINKGKESTCEWIPDIPENGRYAVYVSYQSLPNSSDEALYTVYHCGGQTSFKVNQTMGGGTWIFLGFFKFEKGVNKNQKVVLSNIASKSGKIITADAVKIGGGMGNIARLPHQSGIVTTNAKSSESLEQVTENTLAKITYTPETSGYPRYTEAARYWLQWAGIPDSIYNKSNSKNDYTDDYQSRGLWVNYLSGGSSVLPKKEGLNIPIDLAMAFHSDAGNTYNDSIIGSLGIYMTHTNNEKFENGKSRWTSRDLTNAIMDEIVKDIRIEFEPNWTRRQMWNRSYSEARTPNVPTMLLELLSHQNFADMRYGLDPNFRFTVSRSIYKGMLKFIAHQYGRDYVVQPLPVQSFSTEFVEDSKVRLQWTPQTDPSEPTAQADKYIVYTRIGDADFDNGKIVNRNEAILPIEKDKLYSFKVTAVNNGGESFPSEILAVCRVSDQKGCVIVVNAFNRLAAPHSFNTNDSIAGFVDFIDHGVPYQTEYHYTGSQYEFRRKIPWIDDDAPGFGASQANYENRLIAGNTFDYPYWHGQAISKAGYSFVSASAKAISDGNIELKGYTLLDLIAGKQKESQIARGAYPSKYKLFTKQLQSKITAFCQQGGHIFISGAYVGSDIWDNPKPDPEDQKFATEILKYKWRTGRAAVTGLVKSVNSPYTMLDGRYEFHNQLNAESYAVESPDAIEPAGENSFTIFRYSENNLSAGIASDGKYKTCILGFPFETIKEAKQREELMRNILLFIDK